MRPLARETTLSFIERLAGRFHTTAYDLIAEFFAFGNRKPMSSLIADGEVYFNADARDRFAALCAVPPQHLERALPAWTQLEPVGRYDAGPAATFYGAASIPPTAAACTRCVAACTGRAEPARLYTAVHQRVCVRHHAWLLATQDDHSALPASRQLSLAGLPQVIRAQGRHTTLLGRRELIAEAFPVAQAITTTWRDAERPRDTEWPRRLEQLAAANQNTGLPPHLAWEIVTYPETVALAGLLASRFWQRQVLNDAGNHQPHVPADTPNFTRELAHRLRRPWLAEALAATDSGPLTAWLQACWRSRADQRTTTTSMWWIPPAYRTPPAPPGTTARSTTTTEPEEDPGDAGHGFARGLALARAFAADHGHLCIPSGYQKDGVKLGLWLANQRAAGPKLAPERSRALAALDPWWNPPWSTRWQRLYLRAHRQVASGTVIRPREGFDDFSENLGTWLFQQCLRYEALHPQQQKLLSQIGITPHDAQHARRRARSMEDIRAEYLDQARIYWEKHRHLCARSTDTQDGYPIGQVLANLRVRARRGRADPAIAQVFTGLDPWWAAPWPPDWQRACYAVLDLVRRGHVLDPENAFTGFGDELGQWLYTQCATYPGLAVEQRRQLAAIGLTEQVATTARPNPATNKPSLETGLHYARSYAALHGDLNTAPTDRHEGFPIGAWLSRQRRQANLHASKFTSPYPAGPLLAALDPWWNPPWSADWQINHRAARKLVEDGLELIPQRGFPGTPDWTGQWLYAQCTAYQSLHPGQRHMLARLGITAANARRARPRRITQQASFETGLGHARSFAAHHGHLAASRTARHDGYRLGSWLATQRQRAANDRLPRDRVEALTTIAPWWNPPWGLPWQMAYHTVRTETRGHTLHAPAGFPCLPPSATRWLLTQCINYASLHPGQQQLLADLGITEADARTARPQHEPRKRPHTGAGQPRPTTVSSSIDGGLPYARSYAHAHCGLGTAHYDAEHDGFPLGWWLYEQRKRAKAHLRRTNQPWPHEQELAALDPYWNPPWRISWQHTYTRIRSTMNEGRRWTASERHWLTTQHTNWHTLHPDQRRLLTAIGLTPADEGPSAPQSR
ncbi:helicase associated domain-containing protein [Streptomyces sp. Ncost-T10-10d]|uniref:helicase associated domain-containing protein n=1 Tax=Streptomyces sp. Ncost-T10-10d TaxID=1839774 RepID=UPI00081F1BDB|nr:helicase associated domain-containing protein [Streptomyces sp. Ncost-T10-10d]SCF66260.1 TniQ protein [Streptomyces sp. Ncost-T10-10d]